MEQQMFFEAVSSNLETTTKVFFISETCFCTWVWECHENMHRIFLEQLCNEYEYDRLWQNVSQVSHLYKYSSSFWKYWQLNNMNFKFVILRKMGLFMGLVISLQSILVIHLFNWNWHNLGNSMQNMSLVEGSCFHTVDLIDRLLYVESSWTAPHQEWRTMTGDVVCFLRLVVASPSSIPLQLIDVMQTSFKAAGQAFTWSPWSMI